MSIIGPRPGLWNQDVLTAERDKYGANDVKPGLTGWAQINGRDELEIPEKAKLDGYYVQNMGFKMDAKVLLCKSGHCFLDSLLFSISTISSFVRKKSCFYFDRRFNWKWRFVRIAKNVRSTIHV